MTAQALAEHLEVSERTIYRDIDALSSSGIPIYTERGPGGGCELLDGYQTKLTGLTLEEVRALFLLGSSGPLADLGLNQALEDALLKLSATIPTSIRSDALLARQRIYVDPNMPNHSHQPGALLRQIQEALWQDYTLRLTYDNKHNQALDPYGLVSQAGQWFLIGAGSDKIQVLNVAHIQTAELCNQHFTRPDGFDLGRYWTEHLSHTRPCVAKVESIQSQKKAKMEAGLYTPPAPKTRRDLPGRNIKKEISFSIHARQPLPHPLTINVLFRPHASIIASQSSRLLKTRTS
jgi:predicted DNA-binding transcriptional regulator YafY